MAKGQKKSNREPKKAKKAEAAKPSAAVASSLAGTVSGTSYKDRYAKKTSHR